MTEQPPAYWSRLTISFGPEGELFGPPEPGPVNDTSDPELARLMRLAVRPVVESLITADELESLSLHRAVDDADEIWVQLTARGERFFAALPADAPDQVVRWLAEQLEDWICETRFAWGEQRTASYSLPTDAE